MSLKVDNRKDILLLLLYSPGRSGLCNEPIVGRTRLMKMLFLFKQEVLEYFKRGTDINSENFYEYFAWDFGPFSREVYDDLTFFILREFIKKSDTEEDTLPESAAEWSEWIKMSRQDLDESVSEYQEQEFSLSEKGVSFAENLYSFLSSEQQKLLKEFKSRTTKVPLRGLLKYVYESYESYTEKSKLKPQILR